MRFFLIVVGLVQVVFSKKLPFEKKHKIPSPRVKKDLGDRASKPVQAENPYVSYDKQVVKKMQQQAKDTPNSDPMTSISAVYYIGPVDIGGQVFNVIYDTGSNLLWVPSSSCGSSCAGHPSYSGNFQSANQGFSVQYGSGPVSGNLGYAPVTLADASLSSFKIGLATDVGFSGFNSAEFDGILGLAWPGLSSDEGADSIVPAFYSAGQIPANLFTIYLNPDGSSGELSLGEIDTSRYQGDITWLPLTKELWWTIDLNAVGVAGSSAVSGQSDNAILDSGTSTLVGPNEKILSIIDSIQSSAGIPVYYDQSNDIFAVKCSDVNLLPNVTFTLSGSDNQEYLYTMPGPSYVLKHLSSDPSTCPLAFQGDSSGGSIDWILGDPFLRTFYSIYDYENKRAGLAPAYPSAGSVVPGGINGVLGPSVFVAVVLSVLMM